MFWVLSVDLPVWCLFINMSSDYEEEKYCPSSLFMVVPPFFLIAIASFIQRLNLSCSVPMSKRQTTGAECHQRRKTGY